MASHPAGQYRIVTSGTGSMQEESGGKQESPPGIKHWHGATPTLSMSRIAITNRLDGKKGEWMEHIADEQYPD